MDEQRTRDRTNKRNERTNGEKLRKCSGSGWNERRTTGVERTVTKDWDKGEEIRNWAERKREGDSE